jgi:hypothetical protein
MDELRYTLVSDGTSDRRLLPIINWCLQQCSRRAIASTRADFSMLGAPPRSLAERVRMALELYPADLLLVHRDAETASRQQRLGEIEAACAPFPRQPLVPVIPIRMHEAWLLFDAAAIRSAAGNPRGRMDLGLPPKSSLERVADPKAVLYDTLIRATGLSGRHLRRFNVRTAAYRVSELITDYAPLRGLTAFDALEADLAAAVRAHGLA